MKYFFIGLAYLFLLPFCATAQDIAAMQKEAERLEPTNQEQAFAKYKEILTIQPVHVVALTKCSELCSAIGHRQATKAGKLDYFKAARRYAEIALRLNAKSSDANFAMAVAMGRMAMVVGGRQKIEAVNDIKKYAELSLKYDSNNYKAYHVLGKWHYEVSNLSSIERAGAKVFYGGLPASSFKLSIYYYDKSRRLAPTFLLNYLELAKAYHKDKQHKAAIDLLNKLMAMPNTAQDDSRIKEEAKTLLKEWSK